MFYSIMLGHHLLSEICFDMLIHDILVVGSTPVLK
jgi:hypothetical protein